jgi:hypothetical protein
MIEATLLVTALLFGGMVLYSFGFAAFLFANLPAQDAGPLLRRAFPHFYLFVLGTSGLGAGLASLVDLRLAAILAAIAVTTVLARQVLMPMINAATDAGAKARFKWLHGLSVLVTLGHIGAAGYVLVAV